MTVHVLHKPGVTRKNKVTDNLVKIKLDIDQAFAVAQFHDKIF